MNSSVDGPKIRPSQYAVCRTLAGNDAIAGILLYRIVGLWTYRETKKIKRLSRLGREWIAMSRSEWAFSAGLTEAEMKGRALPRLKKSCASFLVIRSMKLSPLHPKTLWVSLDWDAMQDAVPLMELAFDLMNGFGISSKKAKYLYKDHLEG